MKHRILFLEELDGLLSILVGKYKRLLLCGDINLHFENPTDNFSRKFLDLITDYGFEYHIDGQPTHEKGALKEMALLVVQKPLIKPKQKFLRFLGDIFAPNASP